MQIPVSDVGDKGVNTRHSMTWTEYHNQDDIEGYLNYLAAEYDFVDVESIGQSYEGRPMRVVKVCSKKLKLDMF